MPTTIRVSLDYQRLAPSPFLSRVNAIYAGMNLNPAYSNPPVPMPEFRKTIDDYAAAVIAAPEGGAKARAQRDVLREMLNKMVRKLAHYVEAACNDDMATFLSSGFLPLNPAPKRKPPLTESIRKIVSGASGELLVSLVKLPGAVSYELRWAPVVSGAPGEWTSKPVARTQPAVSVADLTPGTAYAFQGRALTPSGLTEWSASVIRICT